MKTYVLIVSKNFPSYHKRKGDNTNFIDQLMLNYKKHTIRGNFQLWKKRIQEVQKGEAILSIRYWTGKPYRSRQSVICELDNKFGVGIQRLDKMCFVNNTAFIDESSEGYIPAMLNELALNDGLSLEDFKEWFRKPNEEPMAIIHFTGFRYLV